MKLSGAADHRPAGPLGTLPPGYPNPRRGRSLAIGCALAVSLLTLASLHVGIEIDSVRTALLAAAIFGLVHAVAWPLLARLALHRHLVLALLLAFALSGLLLALLSRALPGFTLRTVGAGALVAIALTLVLLAVSLVIAVTDDILYDHIAVRSRADRARRAVRSVPDPSSPRGHSPEGTRFLFLEINGLAEPILREAIAGGHVPTMARWLGSGRHRLVDWECDLSSQISASQAGILHGNNFNIPAFRWYDKATRKIVVSNHVRDGAATIERQVSNGRGLLAGDGACRGTLLSGDAVDSMFTCSTVGTQERGTSRRAFGDLTLFGRARLVMLFAWDAVVEVGRGARHAPRDDQPPVRWLGIDPLGRAFTTAILRELCVQTVIGDMCRGVPTVYLNFAGYDTVAHHSGIRSTPALRSLRGIDRQLARLERANRDAARHYLFVVFSGYGQSQGPTFRRRYGQTLAQLVQELLPDSTVLVERRVADEAVDTAAALLTDLASSDSRNGKWLSRVVEWAQEDQATVEPEPATNGRPAGEQHVGARVALVLASGNLGLVSFPAWPHRLTYEELSAHFPRLLPGLVNHDGIAFVLVDSAEHGAMVFGATGTIYLDDDRIEGEDPLASFGPHAARHLRRQSLFMNCPDILVNSRYDSTTGEVAAFEELIGSHGGLGGTQSQPFLLQPTSLPAVAAPIIGACALHELFTRWRRELASAEPPSEVERRGGSRTARTGVERSR